MTVRARRRRDKHRTERLTFRELLDLLRGPFEPRYGFATPDDRAAAWAVHRARILADRDPVGVEAFWQIDAGRPDLIRDPDAPRPRTSLVPLGASPDVSELEALAAEAALLQDRRAFLTLYGGLT